MIKKLVAVLGIAGLVCLVASPAMAGGIINKSNLSADYFRSLSRHASMDAADIIAFNPAGVMKMENGFHTKLDILYIQKDYTNKVPSSFPIPGASGTFESDDPSIVPGFFTLYKQEKWAGYFAVTIPGGGGRVDFTDGNARTSILGAGITLGSGGIFNVIDSMRLEADSYAVGYTVGGAYAINDTFSIAGGIRLIDSRQEFKGNVVVSNPGPATQLDVDLQRTAMGWGYHLGLNVTPTSALNIGLLYQSNTDLNYKSEVTRDDPGITPGIGWADGTKEREDLPGLIGLGVGYQFTSKLRGEIAYTRYLEESANLEAARFQNAGDSWEVGFSLTYAFSPKWRASIGYLHTDIEGMNPEDMLPEAPELDAQTIGVGAVYSPTPALDITLGYTHVNYDEVTTDAASQVLQRAPAGTEYDKEVRAISAGVSYRWF